MAIKGIHDTDCIEYIMEKDEITHFEQFHLLPQCFPKAFFFNVLEQVYMEGRVKGHYKFHVSIYRPPREGLDSKATIRIDDREFEVEANDLEFISVLGRGAYGVVEKYKHRITNTILAVKVCELCSLPFT